MQIAVPATPILTKGDHAANVGSYARHMRAENLPADVPRESGTPWGLPGGERDAH